MTTTYSVQMTDSETPASWMGAEHVVSCTPGAQSGGKVRMTVVTTDADALEASLMSDADVLDYERA